MNQPKAVRSIYEMVEYYNLPFVFNREYLLTFEKYKDVGFRIIKHA